MLVEQMLDALRLLQLRPLLLQLLIGARTQLRAHDDVHDRRGGRDGQGDGERCRKRKPKAERHGSRST
jgi:hypothetical protein